MRLRSFWHFGRVTFFLLDYVLAWGAVVCAIKVSPRYPGEVLDGLWLHPELRFIGYGMPLFMVLGLQLAGMQATRAGFRNADALTRTFLGLAGGLLAFAVIHSLVEFGLIGRYVLGFTLAYGVAFILASRLLVWKLAERDIRNVLIYGSSTAARDLRGAVEQMKLPIRILGHTRLPTPELGAIDGDRPLPVGVLGLHGFAEKNEVEDIVVEVPDALNPIEREALLHCTGQGVNVLDLGYFYERVFERVHVPSLRESWFWGYDPNQAHPVYFAFKRFTDIVVSVAGLIAFIPFFPFLALLIKLQDGGPVIYSQVRIGLYNQPFRIFKFRTMRVDAEKKGARWAATKDERVTLLGRIMRKTRIDEVPQFWNILRGDMSFVGPRPERPEFVDIIEKAVPYYRYRHLIKPGLSGWAQINYPYGASIEDAGQKLSYDLYYLKYASGRLDLLIVLRTSVAMVMGSR